MKTNIREKALNELVHKLHLKYGHNLEESEKLALYLFKSVDE